MTSLKAVQGAAVAWTDAGASVVRVAMDGSKRPDGDWKAAQTHPTSRKRVAAQFAASRERTGVGIVLGVGGFECLEFETGAAVIAYGEAAERAGLDALLQRVIDGYHESTPGGGVHLIWRCTEPDAVAGNTKLAATADGKTIAETRGRGGFVIVAPSHGAVHPSGKPYQLESGSPATAAQVTPEEREELLALARTLDRRPVKAPREKPLRGADGARPGDAFNTDGPEWAELLEPAGWTRLYEADGLTHWCRPGKTAGVSATTGVRGDGGDDLLWVFSTNAEPFEAERSYDKFGAYAVLEAGGDLAAAARKLAADGYGEEGASVARFALVSAAELAQPVPPMRWLVRGVWPENSHGPLAGAKKSLKSWNALALAVAVASGQPYLGKFDVDRTGPVLYLNGEGGQEPYQRRYQRICEAYGVDAARLPIWATFGSGAIDGKEFREEIRAHLDAVRPVLVILDPLYVFHPTGIEAQNLYERGRMLGDLSTFIGHETGLIVVDHYRKTGGQSLDLDEIGQSGVAQWADSWILQAHRDPPDLEAGSFRLSVEHGSRQWGGRRWAIDWECGAFDYVLCEPDGQVSWTVEPADGASAGGSRSGARNSDLEVLIFKVLEEHPRSSFTAARGLAREAAEKSGVKFSNDRFKEVWTMLAESGRIREEDKKWSVRPAEKLRLPRSDRSGERTAGRTGPE